MRSDVDVDPNVNLNANIDVDLVGTSPGTTETSPIRFPTVERQTSTIRSTVAFTFIVKSMSTSTIRSREAV